MNEGSVPRSYIITWKISNNGSTSNQTTTKTSTTITSLQSNTVYAVTIRTWNNAGSGESSDQVDLITGKRDLGF